MRSVLKSIAKLGLSLLGIPTSKGKEYDKYYHDYIASNNTLSEELQAITDSFSDDDIVYQKGEGKEYCWPDSEDLKIGAIYNSKYFIAKRAQLIRQICDDLDTASILDVGASSDVIFKHIGKKGVGVNISKDAVRYMKKQGIDAVCGDAENLEFEDNSFDYVISFQTLEHLKNPIKALEEYRRVARQKVLVTIPHVTKTRVCSFSPEDRAEHRWHVFEFSPKDFEIVANKAGLTVKSKQIIRAVNEATPKTWKQKIYTKAWARDSYFLGYMFFELDVK